MDEFVSRIATKLRAALRQRTSIDDGLDDLLQVTQARATGLWIRRDDHLELIGFRTAQDMPVEIQETFAAATATVPLSQIGLGIVKAVVKESPVVATLSVAENELADSARWLARFEAKQSLAVPILSHQTSHGVLAISTAQDLNPTTAAWQLMLGVAEKLADCILGESS